MHGLIPALGFVVAAQVPAPASGGLPDFAPLARLDAPGLRLAGLKTVSDAEPARYVVDAAARTTVVYELPGGARTVREITVEPARGTAEAWRTARLRLTWESDEPAAPGVDLPIGLLFGRPTADGGISPSPFVSGDGPVWSTRLPMPYRTLALLQIDTDRPLAGRIVVKATRGVDPDAGYLRAAAWVVGGPAPKDQGRGRIIGAMVVTEAGAIAARRPGLGELLVDGRASGWFSEAVGVPGAAAAFRWRASDPISYEQSFTIDGPVDPGGAVRAVVFWYSDRPGTGRPPSH